MQLNFSLDPFFLLLISIIFHSWIYQQETLALFLHPLSADLDPVRVRKRKWILNMVDLQNQLRTSYNQVMLAVLILICLFLEFFASIVFLVWDFVWKWKSSLKIRATCNLSVYTKCGKKKMPNAKKKKKSIVNQLSIILNSSSFSHSCSKILVQ